MSDKSEIVDSVSNLLNVSARVAGAVAVACAIVLFFPEQWLPFQIDLFRMKYGLWIFLIMVTACSLCLSYAGKWGVEKIKAHVKEKEIWDTYETILRNLSTEEKLILKLFYEKRETAMLLDLSDPKIKKLETFRVISQASGTNISRPPYCPGFIQPWVFEVIDKYPDIIKVEEKGNEQT